MLYMLIVDSNIGCEWAIALARLMINHGLWSDADAAPTRHCLFNFSKQTETLLLPEFDILQMVPPSASLANYRIGGGGRHKS